MSVTLAYLIQGSPDTLLTKIDLFITDLQTLDRQALIVSLTYPNSLIERNNMRTQVDLCNSAIDEIEIVKDATSGAYGWDRNWTDEENKKLVKLLIIIARLDAKLKASVKLLDAKLISYWR